MSGHTSADDPSGPTDPIGPTGSINQAPLFASVGTSLDPFDRLVRLLDELRGAGHIPVPVLIQTGHGRYLPRHLSAVPFLPAPEMEARIAAAPAIVCHGGAGILGTCFLLHRRPVVFPRRAAFGEIVNDHQLELCHEMRRQGRIFLAEDRQGLIAAIAQALADRDRLIASPARSGADHRPGDRLRQQIAEVLAKIDISRR